MRIYISGPIKGFEDTYRETFDREEFRLSESLPDVEIVNPVTVGDGLERRLGRTPTYAEYMKEDLLWLLNCSNIVMLPGWENSKGAKLEHDVAIMCGIEVDYPL